MRFFLLVLVAALLVRMPAAAAATPEQRAEITAVGTLVTKAGNLYKNNKFKEAGEAVKEVQSRLEKLAEGADPQMVLQLEAIHKRLVNAHALLELEGISLPALKPLEVDVKPAAGKPGKAGAPARSEERRGGKG